MDYFSPGARELARKLGRLLNRLRLAAQRRRVAQAETQLGLLGWQQADYDPETQREVEKIQNYEREQSQLNNQSAQLGRELQEVRETRETRRKEFEEARRKLEAERRAAAEPLDRYGKQLTALLQQEPLFEKKMPQLDRELREVSRMYSELLTTSHATAATRQELSRLRERTVAIPNEKADLRAQHMRLVSEIKQLETALVQGRTQVAATEEALRQLESGFQAADRELAAEMKAREREKVRVEKEVDSLEVAKANPYQQIGAVLADSNLPPMNQPEVLEKVRAERLRAQELEYELSLSEQVSSQADATLLRISYMLWGVMLFAVALLTAALL